jgi:site-specific DNA-methyltransferase (adenine-specific)
MKPLISNQVIQGDCLELMRDLPDSSVDLICTDPPYFKVKSAADSAFNWWDSQWDKPEGFLAWVDQLAEQWRRILKPNGSLYCFASPRMSARVEVQLGQRFNVLNNIRWVKDEGWHKKADKEIARQFCSPWESAILCEHPGADNIAKGEAGYGAKCDELRGFVFEPLRAYLDGERARAGVTIRQVAEAFQSKTGSRTVTGMAGHWFSSVQWTLPTEENYLWLQALLNDKGRKPPPSYEDFHLSPRRQFEKDLRADYEDLRADYEYLRADYEDLRADYEYLRREYEDLRREYEDLRRPFAVSAEVPYTDVWTFPPVGHYLGKHPCEKPAAMLEHIISASSRPGAVVLDCFSGSGSTLTAAKRLGRQYIGLEIDPHWCDVARGRVGQTQTFVSLDDRVAWLETQVAAHGAKLRNTGAQQLNIFTSPPNSP